MGGSRLKMEMVWKWGENIKPGKRGVVCENKKKMAFGRGPAAVFSDKNTRKKNLKPVGEAPPTLFFLSGEKELVFRVFEFFSECVKNAPPECVEEPSIYRQNVARFFNLVPQLSFFVKFDFLCFFVFFENKQYQRRIKMRKINDFKNDA